MKDFLKGTQLKSKTTGSQTATNQNLHQHRHHSKWLVRPVVQMGGREDKTYFTNLKKKKTEKNKSRVCFVFLPEQELSYCAATWTDTKSKRRCLCCRDPRASSASQTPTAQPAAHVEHEVLLIDLRLVQSVNLFTECAVSSDYKSMMWSDTLLLMPFILNDLGDWVMKNNSNNSDWGSGRSAALQIKPKHYSFPRWSVQPFNNEICFCVI